MASKTRRNRSQAKTPKTSSLREPAPEALQTFTQHISELRRRLFWVVAVSLVVGGATYYYHDFFVRLIMAPLDGQKLIYLTPAGGFSFIFMVTFYVTMLAVLPLVLYQIYAFIRPAIPTHTSRLSLKVGASAALLMAAGATFGYLYAVPGGLHFLTNFADSYITPSLTADSYLSFVLSYVLGIGILFELPLLLLFWHWIHPLTPGGLLNSERFLIVGAFVVAAVISPSPDALTQTIIAVPIIVVYQFGVVAVLLSIRKTRRLEKEQRSSRTSPVALASKPEPVRAEVSTVSKAVPPPAKQAMSMDGMTKRRPVVSTAVNRVVALSPDKKPMDPRHRQRLVVPRRQRIISDFGPIR